MKLFRLATAIVLFAACVEVEAHDARPNYVQIVETHPFVYLVSWKVPATVPGEALPYPTLPEDCTAAAHPVWNQSGAAYMGRLSYQCESGLSGRQVGIAFPFANPSLSTVYRVQLANGEEHLRILKPSEQDWLLPDAENRFAVAKEYTWLGIEHIWIGIDHLMFVACLVLIAGSPKRLLITITGFTVAHSITLALSALNLARVPTPPVEAAIALSVVFMAWEIAKQDDTSIAYRYPVTIAASFGLLHGFGFAAVLRDIGLPQTELPTALLFFNVGVEIGQVLFVFVLLATYVLVRPILVAVLKSTDDRMVHWTSVTVPASYIVGGIASYWLIDRVSSFWA